MQDFCAYGLKLIITNATQYSDIDNNGKWVPYNKGGEFRKWYGNNDNVIRFDKDSRNEMSKQQGHVRPSQDLYFKEGGTWTAVGVGKFGMRYYPSGFLFDAGGQIAVGNDIESCMAYMNSKVFMCIAQITMPTINFKCGVIKNLPDLRIQDVNIHKLVKSNISISKTDWDNHETSWNFKTNGLLEIKKELSSNSVKELQTIHKEKWLDNYRKLKQNEEAINKLFILHYGLQDELTPDVPLDEVTILQQGEISIEKEKTEDGSKEEEKIIWHDDVIIKQFISYLVGCFMGRYSVDKPGLIIANQHQDLSSLNLQVDGIENSPRSTLSIDDDGIVPIIQESDFFADDMTERIQLAIKTLFGEEQYYENMKYIEQTIGKPLRDYLYKDYYADHQQMYSVKGAKRPIYWLFSSRMGDKHKKGYFKALVYMHRMEADTLSKLHADYVHPYINKVEQQLREAEEETLRDDLTQAQRNHALKLVNELKEKVKEVKEFEQELVEMASHRLTIDLDDGVKVNYPKFYPLVEPIKGLECEKK